jgi:hypothetical protein
MLPDPSSLAANFRRRLLTGRWPHLWSELLRYWPLFLDLINVSNLGSALGLFLFLGFLLGLLESLFLGKIQTWDFLSDRLSE